MEILVKIFGKFEIRFRKKSKKFVRNVVELGIDF